MSPNEVGRVRSRLGWFALAVIIGMQAGTIFEPLGNLGETRVADWIDLLTPFAVVGGAGMILAQANPRRVPWLLFGAGAITFTLGHGLHLSANSVSNADDPALKDADIVHLWDEVASHYIWYTGLFVVMAAIALSIRTIEVRLGPWGIVVGSLFALTLVNTYIEGDVAWLGLGLLSAAAVASRRWRKEPVSRLVGLVGGLGLVLLSAWGIAWFIADGRVFPEYSDVGWI